MEQEAKRQLLRQWLRGHGYHPADIRLALAWYSTEINACHSPTDAEVLDMAERCHEVACDVVPLDHIEITYKVGSFKAAFFGGLLGATLAFIIYDVYLWLGANSWVLAQIVSLP